MTVLLAALATALAGILLFSPEVTHAGHSPPVATFAVDVNPADNLYAGDPNSDGNPSDNSLIVGTVDFCIQVTSIGSQTIDIVARNIQDMTAYDIRINYDPSLVEIAAVEHTPFIALNRALVGFLNLPVDPNSGQRRTMIPADNISHIEGTAFFAATYVGARTALSSPDHPHPPSAAEPYSAADPDGVVIARLTVTLNSAASGKVVSFDLANQPIPGNDYISFNPNTEQGEAVPVPDSNLIDGAIAVNTACPPPPSTAPGGAPGLPNATPGAPSQTPGAVTTPTRSPRPAGTAVGPDATATAIAATQTAVAGAETSDADGNDGVLGDDKWRLPLYALAALLLLAIPAALIWRWRRRSL